MLTVHSFAALQTILLTTDSGGVLCAQIHRQADPRLQRLLGILRTGEEDERIQAASDLHNSRRMNGSAVGDPLPDVVRSSAPRLPIF